MLNLQENFFAQGKTLYEQERYEEALAAFEQAIALDSPHSALACHYKGLVLNELQRYEEALAAFEQAIALDPLERWSYGKKAEILELLGRPGEARHARSRDEELSFRLGY